MFIFTRTWIRIYKYFFFLNCIYLFLILDFIFFLWYQTWVMLLFRIALKLFSSNSNHPKILLCVAKQQVSHCWNRCDSRIGRFMRFLETSHVRHRSSPISPMNPCSTTDPALYQFRTRNWMVYVSRFPGYRHLNNTVNESNVPSVS